MERKPTLLVAVVEELPAQLKKRKAEGLFDQFWD
jgi:hypothetical protein